MNFYKISSAFPDRNYIEFVKNITAQDNFLVASISRSPFLLAKAAILKGKKYTVGIAEDIRKASPYFEEDNSRAELVVEDKNLITNPGTEFKMKLSMNGRSLIMLLTNSQSM